MSAVGESRASDVWEVVVSDVGDVVVGGGAGDARTSVVGEMVVGGGAGDARASDVGEMMVGSGAGDFRASDVGEMEEMMYQMDEVPSNSSLTSGWESVEDQYRPKLHQVFNSLEQGEDFYRQYAKLAGFSVRKSATMIDKITKERYSQQFVCSKQGIPNDKKFTIDGKMTRNRSTTRENCLAGIRLQKDPDGKWSIRRFSEVHTHPCVTPRKKQFLRSNRRVTDAQKSLLSTFREANLRPSEYMSVLEIENGGYSDIGCTERDIRNALQKEREEKKVYDAVLLIEHLQEEKEMNPSFYYAHKEDENNKLTHVFWADGLARKAYHQFGDILIFDTTYNTNAYRLVFAPFTGVNHHGQSVNFGAGFIKDEKIDSFLWLFEKWQEAMCGYPPGVIITDQDSAIGAAIQEAFPNSAHRYCMWHILKKLPDKLGVTAFKSGFSIPFQKCVWNSETPQEFETQWEKILHENNLNNHEWLSDIRKICEKWIPAYAKNIFTAGIRTTQRSESMNAYIDKYVNNMNTLTEFVSRFERAIRKQRQNELAADYETLHTKPRFQTELEMEKQMSEIYTREKFYVFQDELIQSLSYASLMRREDRNARQYFVKRVGNSKDSERTRDVMFKGLQEKAICSCKKLETEGIPCRHIIVVLRNEFVDSLPHCYIFKRWTTLVTNEIVYDNNNLEIQGSYGKEQDLDFSELSNEVHKFLNMARSSKEMCALAKSLPQNANKEMLQHSPPDVQQPKRKTLPESIDILPPDIAKTKGSGKRIKGGKEMAIEVAAKPPRMCRCCKKVVHHDSRNCPLKERVSSDEVEGFKELQSY